MNRLADTPESYKTLTTSKKDEVQNDKRWTLYLILCCLAACSGSFNFGYNIGVVSLPAEMIKNFTKDAYFSSRINAGLKKLLDGEAVYASKKALLAEKQALFDRRQLEVLGVHMAGDQDLIDKEMEKVAESNQKCMNATGMICEEALKNNTEKLAAGRKKLDDGYLELAAGRKKIEEFAHYFLIFATAIFVVGGMIGTFSSKNLADKFGRKMSIIIHFGFSVVAAVLMIIGFYSNRPELFVLSRFLNGVQGGMACCLVPPYLAEISPNSLRGMTGVFNQLGLTFGIFLSNVLGFHQLLGTPTLWPYLLSIPLLPALLGGFSLLMFFPESPKELLLKKGDENSAAQVLKLLRNSKNIQNELDEMVEESRESNVETMSIPQLFISKELRWPLITGIALQLTQQLCGINAIFFYSSAILSDAGVSNEHLQYAVSMIGAINVLVTLCSVPLIDTLGRKPLLVVPLFLMIVDFILLTVFLVMKNNHHFFPYLCIACILMFVILFAIGLGPIPFIYVAEIFRQNSRSAALSICMFVNWSSNLIISIFFPIMASILEDYVFLIFVVVVGFALVMIVFKVPETKGKSPDEILNQFNSGNKFKKNNKYEDKLLTSNA